MAIKTKAELKTSLDENISTNGVGAITGAILNGYETDVKDSFVSMTDSETVAGVKTFSSSPVVPTPTTDYQASPKKYVDDNTLGSSKISKLGYGVFGYISVKANTPITTAATYVPVLGTFTNVILSGFQVNPTPAIEFTGDESTYFEIDWHATLSSNTAGATVTTAIYLNGSAVSGSDMDVYCKNAGENYTSSGTCVVLVENGDEVEIVTKSDKASSVVVYNKLTTTINDFIL